MTILELSSFMFGFMGLGFAIIALRRISKLEKELKETGILNKEYKSG